MEAKKMKKQRRMEAESYEALVHTWVDEHDYYSYRDYPDGHSISGLGITRATFAAFGAAFIGYDNSGACSED